MNRSADWLAKAERDLSAAEHAASGGFHEWAAFSAQQAAEKAAKALIQALHGAERGHSVTGLFRQLPSPPQEQLLDAARELDQVYITSRYPNGFAEGTPGEHFSQSTSRRLIAYARAIFEFCRSQISGSR